MSTLRSATGRTWMAFILAAALVVVGYAVFIGPSSASAQESPPVPTVVPREDSPDSEAIAPAADEGAAEQAVIAPAPDEGAQEQEQAAEQETPEDASGQKVIAPAPDAGEAEDLIAPAPRGESGDDGTCPTPALGARQHPSTHSS